MSPSSSAALPMAYGVLRILIVLNWLFGAAILLLLMATIVAERWTMTALGLAPSPDNWALTTGVRAIAVLGVVSVALYYAILKRLVAMVETVRAGDPFVAANAVRLQSIAWVLLGLQVLSIVIGTIGRVVSTPAHALHLDAGFSTSGWVAVLLTFVLARVFAAGSLMREDLQGTV